MTVITNQEQLRSHYDPTRERSALKELTSLDNHASKFISLSPFVVLSTYGADGRADCSPRGGEAGFVQILDSSTLLIGDAPGNNRLDSLENIVATGQIGLLFLIPGVDESLRINGTAQLYVDESLRERCTDHYTGKPRIPKLVIQVTVQASYLHCAKALMRSALWDASRQIERATLPSMGEMLRDQVADRATPGTVFETQEQMIERYKQTL